MTPVTIGSANNVLPGRSGVRRTGRRLWRSSAAHYAAMGAVDESSYAARAVARLPNSKLTALKPLHFTVDVLEIGFDGYVLAELLHAQVGQWRMRRNRDVRKRNPHVTG